MTLKLKSASKAFSFELSYLKPTLIIILIMSQFAMQSCVDKKIYDNYNRLIVGNWNLVELQEGEEVFKNIPEGTKFQFTADGQIVVNTADSRTTGQYTLSGNQVTVDDGAITNIKEKITVKALTADGLELQFSMRGEEIIMKFQREIIN